MTRKILKRMTLTIAATAIVAGDATPAMAVRNAPMPADTAANRATVRMITEFGACSGTLVAPNIVLTAGHCIKHPAPDPLPHPSYGGSRPKVNDQDWENPGQWYPLYGHPNGIEIRLGRNASVPDYKIAVSRYAIATNTDTALLKLDGSVPATIALPVPVLTRPPSAQANFWDGIRTVAIAGFGATSSLTTGVARTRGCVNELPNYLCYDSTDGSATVPGDSGGSVFWTDPATGQRWLAGVIGTGNSAGYGSALNTSHRGVETDRDIFPDMQRFYERALGAADLAFARVRASGSVDSASSKTPTGQLVRVTKWTEGPGRYTVTLPTTLGTIGLQATAVHGWGNYCQATPVSATQHWVHCYDLSGVHTDSDFSVVASNRWADARAMIWADGAGATVRTGANPSASAPTVSRTATGRYTVRFPGSAFRNVTATALINGTGAFCSVLSWSWDAIYVGCTRPGGAATDTPFSVQAATTIQAHENDRMSDMFAWVDQPTTASYTTPAAYSQQNGDQMPAVSRLFTGGYRLIFGAANSTIDGNWQATAYGRPDVHCAMLPKSSNTVDVNCFDSVGNLVDARFTARYLKPAN